MTPVPFDPRLPPQEGAAVAVPPWELFLLEQTWDLWLGSATEIERLAARADQWMRQRFDSVPLDVYVTQCIVGTTRWAGGSPIASLQGALA